MMPYMALTSNLPYKELHSGGVNKLTLHTYVVLSTCAGAESSFFDGQVYSLDEGLGGWAPSARMGQA